MASSPNMSVWRAAVVFKRPKHPHVSGEIIPEANPTENATTPSRLVRAAIRRMRGTHHAPANAVSTQPTAAIKPAGTMKDPIFASAGKIALARPEAAHAPLARVRTPS